MRSCKVVGLLCFQVVLVKTQLTSVHELSFHLKNHRVRLPIINFLEDKKKKKKTIKADLFKWKRKNKVTNSPK